MSFTLRDMPQSFYVASRFSNKGNASRLGTILKQQFGMHWFRDHDWTRLETETPITSPFAPVFAARDLLSATNADLFVKLLTTDRSFGAFAELGARLGAGRIAHVIAEQAVLHLFHAHPMVRLYESEEQFIAAVQAYYQSGSAVIAPAGVSNYVPEPF